MTQPSLFEEPPVQQAEELNDKGTASESATNPGDGKSADGGSQGTKGVTMEKLQEDMVKLKEETIRLEERYKNSSQEAIRLHQELKSRDLANQASGFPDEETRIKILVNEIGMDEKHARHQARTETANYEGFRQMHGEMEAVKRSNAFLNEQLNKTQIMRDPDYVKALEVFKDAPELLALPPIEMVERFHGFQAKGFIPKTSAQDRSELARAASGSPGSATGRNAAASPASTAANESLAKLAGFPSSAAMEAFKFVKTESDHAAWSKKFANK